MSGPTHPVDAQRSVELLRVLGRGGFGSVYLADLHGADGFVQRVAVKVLGAQLSASTDIAARQRDEARLLARLHHDHIVRVMDLTTVHGRPAVIMEYIDGADLGAVVRQGPLPTKVALQAISQAASALHAAWESVDPRTGGPLRVVHRDIKPSNLLLSRHGSLKVLDFGIARGDFEREGATGSVQFGTTRFMAPEQWLYRTVSDRVDVYALGVTLVELLAGAALERAPLAPERFAEHMQSAVRAVVGPDLPAPLAAQLAQLLEAMLAFEPTHRPSAQDVHEATLTLADDLPGEGLGRFARRVVPQLLAARSTQPAEADPLLSGARTTPDDPARSPPARPRLTPIDHLAGVSSSDASPPTVPLHAATVQDPPTGLQPPPEPVRHRPRRSGAVVGLAVLLVTVGLVGSLAWLQTRPVAEPGGPVDPAPPRVDPPTEVVDSAPSPAAAPSTPAASAPAPTAHTTPASARPPAQSSAPPSSSPASSTSKADPTAPPAASSPETAPAPDRPPPDAVPSSEPPPPDAPTHRITLTSSPIGARVILDGTAQYGRTPIQLSVSRGSHTVRIEHPDGACDRTIQVSPLAASTYRCDLATRTLQAIR